MNTKANQYLAMLPVLVMTGCLGPNPLLSECGQKWEVVAKDAQGLTDDGQSQEIKTNTYWTKAELCFSPSGAAKLSDPQSTQYEALRSIALLACEEQAAALDLVSNNCEESLTEPVHLGSCFISKDQCDPSDGTGESGDTGNTGDGTTGDDPPFDPPSDLVACVGGTCVVQQALIDQVLTATSSTFAADGTYVVPHMASSGVQDGWAFAGIVPGNLGHALGFRDGDVVTEVAGEPVDSWAVVIDVANEALHAERVELVFVRDNMVHTRTYVRR